MSGWLALLAAALLEIVWASLLVKAFKDNATVTTITIAAMAGSFALLRVAMRTIPIGTAYAVWTGLGAAGTVLVGVLIHSEPLSALRLCGLMMIVLGAGMLKFAKST